MRTLDFYTDFDYTDLTDLTNRKGDAEFSQLKQLGVDKVYFSGDQPAVFFKEVSAFSDTALKEIAQVHHFAWNYRKVMFLIALSPTEIRIYNCSKKPFNYLNPNVDIQEKLQEVEVVNSKWEDIEALQTIKNLFSRIAVDCGTLWNTENELRDKIDVQQRIDRYLVKSLLAAAKELKKNGLKDSIIHSIMMRSIFIMYLEDKGAASETGIYNEIIKGASSYLDVLNDVKGTYTLFNRLQGHFNGDVFPIVSGEEKVTAHHLSIIKNCLIDGDLSFVQKLFSWRIFRFDFIQIELLSEIYENFLEEFKEQTKEEKGQYYTPPTLVELILNEKLPVRENKNFEVRVLDPACGSGIFLVESFKRLVQRWKNANPGVQIEFKDLRKILKENIFGIEYDKLAIRVAAFSLYLAIVEHLNPKTLWSDKRYKFPHLITDSKDTTLENQGKNLLRADTIGDVKITDFPKIDLIVGNPPFGAKIKLKSIKDYCTKYGFGKDMVIPFLHKAVDFCDNGNIALIFNTKILTNTEGPFSHFRKWLFNSVYVEKIYNLSIFRKAPKTFGRATFFFSSRPCKYCLLQEKCTFDCFKYNRILGSKNLREKFLN